MTNGDSTARDEYFDGMDWQIPDLDEPETPDAPPKEVDWNSPSVQRFLASFSGMDTLVRPTVRKPTRTAAHISTKFSESFSS